VDDDIDTSVRDEERTAPADSPEPEPSRVRFRTPIGTLRVLQIVLGAFWLIDAALQYQPFMFGKQFASTYITANASGQPEPINWLITTVGHFVSPNVGVWNALFATIQLLIGVGLLFPPTVRPALVTSFFWVFGVWLFGEGLGGLLTGTASALSGTPGSVFMYGVIGLMAWPRLRSTDNEENSKSDGIASSAASHGIGGPLTPLLAWSGFWLLSAVLFLFPANRAANSVSSAITGMAGGEPSWYARALTDVGNGFGSAGATQTWVLALLSVVIALGPLLVRCYEPFLAAGAVLSLLFWLTAQGLGGVLTGSGTDPNTGPLIIVLALAMVPTVVARPTDWSPPIARLVRRHPAIMGTGAIGVFCALLLAATYPAAAQPSGGSMSGMTGMSATSGMSGMESGNTTASTAHCTPGNNGAARSGLDVTNSPNMQMSGPGTIMNMNGADASAAAGLNSVKENWSYTGPALPTGEANELLTEGANGPTDIHMAETGCAAEPTFSAEINAVQYVQATSQAVARFTTPLLAAAAGYMPVSPLDYPVTYYVNPQIVAANNAASHTLDPESVDGLVYAQIPSGQQVLAGAFYLLPTSLNGRAPMPYGPLVQWHQRTDVCAPPTNSTSSPLVISGVTPCAAGTTQQATPYITMVWQVPVAGGPLAVQPPDVQIVEAAMTQTIS
jgi:hypothetical protein